MSAKNSNHIHDENQSTHDAYYMPDEIVILARYEPRDVDKGRINQWLGKLSQCINDGQYHLALTDIVKPVPTFRPEGGPSVLFLPVQVKNLTDTLEDRGDVANNVINIVSLLNRNVFMTHDGMTFMSASPNWLLQGATHGFGDGGPGGLPSPVSHELVNNYKFDETVLIPIRDTLGQPSDVKTDPPVNVVILDTAPSAGYETFQNQSLLKTLVPKLTVHRAADLGIGLPPGPEEAPHHYEHLEHIYNMSDHGLFIAGIIHSWAPTAEIQLFEVLNSYGICTLTGLAQAFTKLVEEIPPSASNPPLIINCSFCITFPQKADPKVVKEISKHRELGKTIVDAQRLEAPETALETMRSLFQMIQETYKDSCVCILAAAGNDASHDHDTNHDNNASHNHNKEEQPVIPAARYPAAFNGVIGIGALEKDGTPTKYSNKADMGLYEGLMVFGGKASGENGGPGISDPQDGVIGIYLSDFPSETKSTSEINAAGWASWSGTSFATAITSGIIASLAADGYEICGKGSGDNDLVAILRHSSNGIPPNLGMRRGTQSNLTSAD
jgi:hypothetical protein